MLEIVGAIVAIILLCFAALRLGVWLGEIADNKLKDKDLKLEILKINQSDPDLSVILLMNEGGTVTEIEVLSGQNVQVELQRAIKSGGKKGAWGTSHIRGCYER